MNMHDFYMSRLDNDVLHGIQNDESLRDKY